MTRKDFELIARALASARAELKAGNSSILVAGVDYAAAELARVLGRTNPRFDAERFLEACK